MTRRSFASLPAASAALALLSGCGVFGANEGPLDGALVTREDGSSFEVGDLTLRCGSDDQFPGEVVLTVESPRTSGQGPETQGMQLVVVPSLVEAGTELHLPARLTETGVLFFVYDRSTSNEASSQEEESSGVITIDDASCDPAPSIDMRIDAVLGSELFDRDPLDVLGEISLTD